jgi:hypothetical protein
MVSLCAFFVRRFTGGYNVAEVLVHQSLNDNLF